LRAEGRGARVKAEQKGERRGGESGKARENGVSDRFSNLNPKP